MVDQAAERTKALVQQLTRREWHRRRAYLRAIAAEIRACPTCSAGPYCATHPKTLLLELALAQDDLLERSAPGA